MAMLTGIWVWTYQRVFMGPSRPEHSNWARMSMSEKWILALLGVTAAALGVMPMVVTEPMRGAVEALVNAVHVR
jgi:NADH:ubiquinone oxidoreductase subunit 4 (subunit M)